ncbi:MAG: prolyl oligopeptidase family serine peptidase [Planctomycetes bacterium]|nr:prolyl oligopeptidase family serine peptidase [Planctomycetota bacterium]
MVGHLFCVIGMCFVGIAPVFAQGSAEDYQRAAELRQRFSGLVVRDQISPVWLPGGKLLYSVSTEKGAQDLVLIDPQATSGRQRLVLSELPELAKALGGRKARLLGAASGADGAVQVLYADGSAMRVDPSTSKISELEMEQADGFLIEPSRNSRAGRGGRRTTILFVNRTSSSIELRWISGNGPGRSYGEVAPGETRDMSTYEGHLWRIDAPESASKSVDGDDLAPLYFRGRGQPGIVLLQKDSWEASAEPRTSLRKTWEERDAKRDGPSVGWKIQGGNLFGPSPDLEDRERVAWTTDGTPADSYASRIDWSPGRKAFALMRTREAPNQRRVTIVESSPQEQLQPSLIEFDYTKPGDDLDFARPKLFRYRSGSMPDPIAIDDALFGRSWSVSRQSWSADGGKYRFLVNERGHQRLAYYEVDIESGEVRTLIDERSDTFVDYSQKTYLRVMEDRGQVLWMSERSGWNHLYLIDLETAEARPLTQGEWVVRSVEDVRDDGTLILRVMGVYGDQDPYHMHFARVDLDSGELTMLTESDGTHDLRWSPDGARFLARWSRVDHPPVHELRRIDGSLICVLEESNVRALMSTQWKMPQRFVAPGRDEKTEIWGVVYRPTNFDPERSYPVIENIYAGPHGFHVEKSWSLHRKSREMAELGFIVVRIDGMGTNWRSKAFHNIAWKNIADAGFPDRKLWIEAFAATEPAADLSRIGIYGGSAGGQNAMRALIDHGDFYHAAVADCGCHDNRMDKIWWNEAWMGWPIDESYSKSSNVDHAHRMQGDLLLVVGELDRNVDPASTMQVVDALIRANKDFEMLVIPGGGHGVAETPYGTRKRRDFFVRHLLEVNPRWASE